MFKIDALAIVEQFMEAYDSVQKVMDEAINMKEYCEQELNDLAHGLELFTFNASEGYKLAKQFQESRIRRREAKNTIEQLKPLHDLFRRYQGFFKDLKKVHAEIETIRGVQLKRTYIPRVRADLQEQFDQAKKQNVIYLDEIKQAHA